MGWREDYEVNGPGVDPHDYQYEDDFMDSLRNNQRRMREEEERRKKNSNDGCYIATCVYGSYDCPEVWTLRRYRDNYLKESWAGRAFVRIYYAISPKLVHAFGGNKFFRNCWRKHLDRMVQQLRAQGYEDTPYEDR